MIIRSLIVPIIGFSLVIISKILKRIAIIKGVTNQKRLKEITDNVGKCDYDKIAEMSLDMVIHLYHINPKRLRFDYPRRRFGFKERIAETNYKQLFYNGNQEDEVSTSYFCSINDGLGNIVTRPIYDVNIFLMANRNIPIEQKTLVSKKAEDNWTSNTTVSIILSDQDYHKLLKLIDEEKEKKRKNKRLEDTKFVLESAQMDLDKMKVQVNKEIETANTMMQEVVNNVRAYQ